MKKIAAYILVFSLLSTLMSCSDMKTYGFAEFEITLPNEYYTIDKKDVYDLTMTNGYAVLGLNRISRADAAEAGVDPYLNPNQFADFYMRKAGIDSEIEYSGQTPYYIYYHTPIGGSRQFCLAAFYRSEYAYFTLFCIVSADAEKAYISDFIDYIDNINFKRSN